jgi:hypothetical protein
LDPLATISPRQTFEFAEATRRYFERWPQDSKQRFKAMSIFGKQTQHDEDDVADDPIPIGGGLTDDEKKALADAEDKIRTGLVSFSEMGQALALIKSRSLYRATHRSFESYLLDRWKIGGDYASKLITAASICVSLVREGLPAPVREKHTRELNRVEPDHRTKVWRAALDAAGGDPEAITADTIAAVAAPRRQRKGRAKAPAAIKIRGKGWAIVLERKKAELDPVAILHDALEQIRDKIDRRAA